MNAAVIPLMLVAALGFLLSVCAHVASIAGVVLPLGSAIWLLHIGIFVVWFPTMLIASRVVRGERRKDYWKTVLAGCPRWMRLIGFGLVAYAFVNFIYFMATSGGHRQASSNITPSTIRGFSGHWMLFYGVAFMTLYSVSRRPRLLGARNCSNGHAVSATDRCCPICGELLREA